MSLFIGVMLQSVKAFYDLNYPPIYFKIIRGRRRRIIIIRTIVMIL